jgi:hypothetical protein
VYILSWLSDKKSVLFSFLCFDLIGDYFAVEILEDSKYGTPIFRTIGGQSKCPGETMTSRRESAVRIIEVIPRCGPDHNQECTGETAPEAGEDAIFGVVVQNLSPTGIFICCFTHH